MDIFELIEMEARRHLQPQRDALLVHPAQLQVNAEKAYDRGELSMTEYSYLSRIICKAATHSGVLHA